MFVGFICLWMPLFERKFVKYSTWKLSLVVEATQTIADIAIAGVAAQALPLLSWERLITLPSFGA